jgi:hypothetical protein
VAIKVGERRIDPREVVSRMSEIASEDDAYRKQLVDLAASRGGIYAVALSWLHELEARTLDETEAAERARLDRERFALVRKEAFVDERRRLQAKLASEVASGVRSRAQAKEEYREWMAAQEAALVGTAGGAPARVSLHHSGQDEERGTGMASTPKSGKGFGAGSVVDVAAVDSSGDADPNGRR